MPRRSCIPRRGALPGAAILATMAIIGVACITCTACAQSERSAALPACEWCGAQDAPDNITTHILTIPGEDEPGPRIILQGRVFQPDGRTPAADLLLYAYHTDTSGIYRQDGGETGNGLRHGALRGWLRTDSEGRYEIRTIKPAPYPNGTEAAHVHITLTPRGGEEDWVDSTLFAGDPLITPAERRQAAEAGRFSHIVDLEPREDGVLIGQRDIRIRQ